MKIFVSYARRDNDIERLYAIKQELVHLGEVYIDDLHDHADQDRQSVVEQAMHEAELFVIVESPHYRKTEWTSREFLFALDSKRPTLTLKICEGNINLAQ
ncbi:toll/interleukin-1 receptor domain-containing protein [Nonomuraea sp. C10]|uniref:toll/interleukin-1 receptor domain-containing protein n=1 Tax=Nonomuraea sp. C10 TaxID=2600577 RepID=UPI0011CE58E9|nr:TIR domain-containing protein [Nonomuraea sp. C10]